MVRLGPSRGGIVQINHLRFPFRGVPLICKYRDFLSIEQALDILISAQ